MTCLDGATVRGPVAVRTGASLLAIDSTISGAVASYVGGGGAPLRQHGQRCLSVSGTTGSLAVVDSTVNGAVSLTGNRTPGVEPVVAGSRVNGILSCTRQQPRPGQPRLGNTVRGLNVGQCAALD